MQKMSITEIIYGTLIGAVIALILMTFSLQNQ